jgi:hypothetical protein
MIASALCIVVGTALIQVPAQRFTLRWQHTVEKIVWEEDYVVAGAWLYLSGARVQGSGAGMEPGEGAILNGGWWVWSPQTRVDELNLAASGATGAGWRLCDGPVCHVIGAQAGGAVRIAPCKE